MNNDNIISAADIMMRVTNSSPWAGNELPSVWKKVVSSVHSYKDESEDNMHRMPIGERLAGNTRVVDLKNGILLVEADHPGWIQYLRLYQKFILKGLNMYLPDLKIKSLAFRVTGTDVSLSDTYNEHLEKVKKETSERFEKEEKQMEEFYKNRKDNQKEEIQSTLPPELMAKFDNIRNSMLTNDDNK